MLNTELFGLDSLWGDRIYIAGKGNVLPAEWDK